MTPHDVVRTLLAGRQGAPARAADAFAPANIALVKYWGKRDEALNLPVTSSLSVSLGERGTRTELTPAGRPELVLDGRTVPPEEPAARRVAGFLALFEPFTATAFRVATRNSLPTAAGLASSASGFAALVLALDRAMDWRLDGRALSILARLGSGSACRSVFTGFVEWHAGARADGMDSHAEPLDLDWPAFRLGIATVSAAPKAVGSREAMRRARAESALYATWPPKAADDLMSLRAALRDRDFERLGRAAESNALAMHATLLGAWPPVLYWTPDSVALMHRVWDLRRNGRPVYFTMDAGPNLKLLFPADAEAAVRAAFPDADLVAPFPPPRG